jgi:hypothetical protein
LTPSDLSKLPALRKRLQAEHGSIQSALSTAVRDQLATTREGLRKFVEAKQALNRVEDGMREVESLLEHENGEGGTTIAEFRKISKVRRPRLAGAQQGLGLTPPGLERLARSRSSTATSRRRSRSSPRSGRSATRSPSSRTSCTSQPRPGRSSRSRSCSSFTIT